MPTEDITIAGTSGVMAALLIVQALKRLGMPKGMAGTAAVIVGLLVAYTAQAITVWPWIEPWVKATIAGLVIGAAAAGVKSFTKDSGDEPARRKKQPEPPDNPPPLSPPE